MCLLRLMCYCKNLIGKYRLFWQKIKNIIINNIFVKDGYCSLFYLTQCVCLDLNKYIDIYLKYLKGPKNLLKKKQNYWLNFRGIARCKINPSKCFWIQGYFKMKYEKFMSKSFELILLLSSLVFNLSTIFRRFQAKLSSFSVRLT